MTLTPNHIYKQPQTTAGWKDHWTERDNEVRQELSHKVADELDRIMSATAEIDWSKEQYSYMNACIRELRDTLRGSSQEGKR